MLVPLEEYTELRRNAGGVNSCFVAIEACNDIILPQEVLKHPVFQRMYTAVSDMVFWLNLSVLGEKCQLMKRKLGPVFVQS
jgi:hypothetical protein